MEQKVEEIKVLKKFINEFDKNIIVLSLNEAKKIFPYYNNENPDFIVYYKANYIGIELFELVLSKNKNILMSQEEKKLDIKNLPHLRVIREQLGTKLLYQNESLADVAVERINDKRNKIKNYVTERIWLLGFANKPFNFRLLDTEIEDNNVENVIKHIKYNIILDKRVEHIFLFQCWGNHKLFNVL